MEIRAVIAGLGQVLFHAATVLVYAASGRGRRDDWARKWTALGRRVFPSYDALLMIRLADYFERVGNLGESETVLRAAVDQHPADGLPKVSLGLLLEKQGRLVEAVDHLESSLTCNLNVSAEYRRAIAGKAERLKRAT